MINAVKVGSTNTFYVASTLQCLVRLYRNKTLFLRKLARLHEILHFSALFYTLSRFRGSCLKRGRDIPFHVLSTEDFLSIHVRHTN